MRGFWLLLTLGLALGGCALLGNDGDRGYPDAFDFDLVTMADLQVTVPTPGRYNLQGYITQITTCPPCPKYADCVPCQYPTGFIFSEDMTGPQPDEHLGASDLIVVARHSGQFAEGHFYRISIDVEARGQGTLNRGTLLGITQADATPF